MSSLRFLLLSKQTESFSTPRIDLRRKNDSPEVVVEVLPGSLRRGAMLAGNLDCLRPTLRQSQRVHVILLVFPCFLPPPPARPPLAVCFSFFSPLARARPALAVFPTSVLAPRSFRRREDLVPKILSRQRRGGGGVWGGEKGWVR